MNHVVHLRDDGCKGTQDLQSFVMVLDEDLEAEHLLFADHWGEGNAHNFK